MPKSGLSKSMVLEPRRHPTRSRGEPQPHIELNYTRGLGYRRKSVETKDKNKFSEQAGPSTRTRQGFAGFGKRGDDASDSELEISAIEPCPCPILRTVNKGLTTSIADKTVMYDTGSEYETENEDQNEKEQLDSTRSVKLVHVDPKTNKIYKHPRRRCSHCPKVLSVGFYKIHKKNHLNQRTPPKDCTLCDKTFKTKASLKAHIENIHEGYRPHSCEYCGKSYYHRASKVMHESSIHELVRYVCRSCENQYSHVSSLAKHERSVHNDGEKTRLNTTRKLNTEQSLVKQQKKHELTKTIQKKCDVVRNNPNNDKLAKNNQKKDEPAKKNQKVATLTAKNNQKKDEPTQKNKKEGALAKNNQRKNDRTKKDQNRRDLSSDSGKHMDYVFEATDKSHNTAGHSEPNTSPRELATQSGLEKNQTKRKPTTRNNQKKGDPAVNNQKTTGVQAKKNQKVDDQTKRNEMEGDLAKKRHELTSDSASHTDNVIGETLVKTGQSDNADRDNDKGGRGIENANTTILKQTNRDIESMPQHGEGNTEPLNWRSHLPEQNQPSICINHASWIPTHPRGILRKPDQSRNNSYTDVPITVLNKTTQKLPGNAESKIPVMNQTLPLPVVLYQRQDARKNQERNCGIFKGQGVAQPEKRGHYKYSQQPSRPSASGYYRPEQSTNKSQNPVKNGNSIFRPFVVSRNPTPNSRLGTDIRRRSSIETAPRFCCSQCPQLFQTYADLKVHEHTCLPKNRKMYSYRYNRENISAGELNRSINYRSPASDDGVECRYCGAFFLECAALDLHVNNNHPKKWGCLYCTLKSRAPAEAKTHIENCDQKPKSSTHLANHLPPRAVGPSHLVEASVKGHNVSYRPRNSEGNAPTTSAGNSVFSPAN